MKSPNNNSIKSSLIITAATIGSGIFALPYVIAQAGWLLALGYFIVLGAMVITTHAVYLKTLTAEGEKQRLLGLARKYFGALGFWFGFVGIVVGLLLSFVIFLILGAQFILLLAPSLPYLAALGIFWITLTALTLVGNRRAASLEVLSVLAVAAIIIFVFASSHPSAAFAAIPVINWHNFFLPFGVVLFTLAGWTGVEPFYESVPGTSTRCRHQVLLSLATGTIVAILLYWLFAAGILSSAPHLTSNTVSGLVSWPLWKRDLIAVFGLFAILTVATPISHELRNTLESDLRWPKILSRTVIIGIPLLAVLAGFTNFITIIGLSGGLFISMEYILILAVGMQALNPPASQKLPLTLISLVFFAAAVYEIASFIVK